MTKAKATEPKLESFRKEDLIRMVRKLQKQIAKLQSDARDVRTLTEAAFVQQLGRVDRAATFPWSTSALLPTVSPIKPEGE